MILTLIYYMKKPFKTCPNCGTVWQTLDEFLDDPKVELGGYQVNFVDLKGGLFYFTHRKQDCQTTMAVKVEDFASLSDRSFLAPRGKLPEGGCSNQCLRKGDIDPCPTQCECVWVREVLQVIRKRLNQNHD
jgi:hypothetical protein